MRKLFFLFFIQIIVVGSVLADSRVTFTAHAPDAVVSGQQFRLSYTVSTHKVRDFLAPSIKGFDVLMGPSRSQQSNTQIINGSITHSNSITFTYILLAGDEGDYTIPGATINADGTQLTSNSVTIKVLPADQSANAGSASGRAQQGSASPSASTGNTISSQDLFVTATANKTTLYEQEAFLLTYKIYTLVDLRLENVKLPDFKGFHSQEVELPKNQKWQLEHYKGRNYHTTIYRQFVLFPQQSGELVIEPARFDAVVRRVVGTVDPFDAFFNGGSNYVDIKKPIVTPRVTMNVRELPSGKPAGFSGGVGEFGITSSINSTEVKTNDAITVKLVISGTGNLKLVGNPEIKFPSDFDVYDPKVDSQVRLTTSGLTGSKVIEYLAIPRHAGTFKIPGVSFSYFDIKSRSYKTVKTDDYEINVEKGEGSSEQVIANFTNKEDLKVLNEDIRFIKLNNTNLRKRGDYFFGSFGYWLIYILPALAFLVYLIVYRKNAAENRNIAKQRTRKANKVAIKRLKLAGSLLAENKKEPFYDEVLKALWGYTSDKLNIPVSKLSKDNVEEKMRKHGVSDELIAEFIGVLNECEFARFAPGDDNQVMDHVYSSAMDVISKMENSIKH